MSKNRIGFYTIDTDYCDYLRKFDSKVPYTMDSKQTRLYHLQRTYNIQAYGNLLQNQLTWCNLNKSLIISKAEKLYYSIINNKCKIAQRCCDFSLLEQKCQEYSIQLSQTQQPILPNQIPPVPTNGFTQGI